MIRWLHISDRHLGNEDMMSSSMRVKLLTFWESSILISAAISSDGTIPEIETILQQNFYSNNI